MIADATVRPVGPQPRGATARAWGRFRRKKVAMIALGFIVLEILIAIFAARIAPFDP
ncbi:MAG: ABC transporter permease, partial [Chloroflexota bacterium]